MIFPSLALAVLVLGCQASSDTVRVHGAVHTAVGEVPVLAHVHLLDPEGTERNESVASAEVGADGAFEISVPREGTYHLEASAVDHERVRIPLVFAGEDSLELDVSLKRTAFFEDPEEVMAYVEMPDGPVHTSLERREDGSWAKTFENLEGETLKYHVFNVAAENDRLVNATSGPFEYDGGGDYFSVAAVQDGRAEVVFDPAAVPPASEEPRPLVESSSTQIVEAYHREREEAAAAAKLRQETRERGDALVQRIMEAKAAGDEELWTKLHAQLVEEFGKDRWFGIEARRLDPKRKVLVGNKVPEFEVELLDGGGKVSDRSLRGRYLLIDFWATWCIPCVGELPQLQKAREKWGEERLQILSLSFDEKPEDITPFRQERFPMPWLNAFVEEGQESDLAKRFEVYGIPYPLLVDPEGKIVAMEYALRGESTLKTLAEYLGEGEPG